MIVKTYQLRCDGCGIFSEEKGLSIEWLETWMKDHCEWLINKKSHFCPECKQGGGNECSNYCNKTMPEEIKYFDANEALKHVKERIKDSLVSLIPDDQWNEMVKKEVDSYFKEKDEGYGDRGRSSSFTREVHTCLQEEVRVKVKEYLVTNFNKVWHNNGVPICNEKVEEMITKNAGKILSDMIGATIQNALSAAGYNLR